MPVRLRTLRSTSHIDTIMTDTDTDVYRRPPTGPEEAAIHCSPPPPPTGTHYEYDAECLVSHFERHEQDWTASRKTYWDARSAVIVELVRARQDLTDLLNVDPSALEPHEVVAYRGKITRANGVIAGLEAALAAMKLGWRNAGERMDLEFYERAQECCVTVPNEK